MSQVALIGISQVGGGPGATGTGTITGPGGVTTYGDGDIVSIVGDTITTHGPGAHIAAHITTGSPDTFVNGTSLVRVGDLASCGCAVLAGDFDAFCI